MSPCQTKLVDGLEISPSAMLGFKFYEVQKYLAITNHAWSASGSPRIRKPERSAARSAIDCDARVHDGDRRASARTWSVSRRASSQISGARGWPPTRSIRLPMRAKLQPYYRRCAPSSARPRGRCSSGRRETRLDYTRRDDGRSGFRRDPRSCGGAEAPFPRRDWTLAVERAIGRVVEPAVAAIIVCGDRDPRRRCSRAFTCCTMRCRGAMNSRRFFSWWMTMLGAVVRVSP